LNAEKNVPMTLEKQSKLWKCIDFRPKFFERYLDENTLSLPSKHTQLQPEVKRDADSLIESAT
jgi:hypothetical protein